jgi:hypothetical protein
MKSKQESITPQKAQEALTEHWKRIESGAFRQRIVSRLTVSRYVSDMKRGCWVLNPHPIVFDESGNLVDGQHRLMAVVEAAVPIDFMVVRDCPTQAINGAHKIDVIDVIDRGKPRLIGGQLQIHGYKNANNVAACVNAAAFLCWLGQSAAITYAATVYILEKLDFKKSIEAISALCDTRQFRGLVVGPLAYYHTTHPENAMAFAESYFGLDFRPKSPAWAFTRYLDRFGSKDRREVTFALAACLRAHHNESTLSKVYPVFEAARWLSDTNPKLFRQIRSVTITSKAAAEMNKGKAA